jgi:hypothetical protein
VNRTATTASLAAVATFSACTATNWRHTAPQNFPPAHEWNAPLEFSWLNAVDTFRAMTAPAGRRWDPLMRNYQPDYSQEEQP